MSTPPGRYLFGKLPLYSVLILVGIILAILIAEREALRKSLPKDTVLDLALLAIPLGILGARVYYVVFQWQSFAAKPISVLYIWEGGLAIYGAVIGGVLALLLYARRKKLSFGMLCDIIAPGLILAQAIGRWGNYFNQEAYGPLVTVPSLQFFPLCVKIGEKWHMATFFYESLWNALIFLMLMLLRKKTRKNGDLFLWYLTGYGSGRFVIEQLRTDSLYWGSLRASQWLSLGLCLLAAALLFRDSTPTLRRWMTWGAALLSIARLPLLSLLPVKHALPWLYLSLTALAALPMLCPSRPTAQTTPNTTHPNPSPIRPGQKLLRPILLVLLAFLPDVLALLCILRDPFPMPELTHLTTGLLCALSLCIHQLTQYLPVPPKPLIPNP